MLAASSGFRLSQSCHSKSVIGWSSGLCSASPPLPDPVRCFSLPVALSIEFRRYLETLPPVFRGNVACGKIMTALKSKKISVPSIRYRNSTDWNCEPFFTDPLSRPSPGGLSSLLYGASWLKRPCVLDSNLNIVFTKESSESLVD